MTFQNQFNSMFKHSSYKITFLVKFLFHLSLKLSTENTQYFDLRLSEYIVHNDEKIQNKGWVYFRMRGYSVSHASTSWCTQVCLPILATGMLGELVTYAFRKCKIDLVIFKLFYRAMLFYVYFIGTISQWAVIET